MSGDIDIGVPFDDIPEGFSPVPAGIYNVIISETKRGVSQKGNPKLSIVYLIEDDAKTDAKGEIVQVRDRKLFDELSLMPSAAWNVKKFLKAAGISWYGSTFSEDHLLGARLQVRVGVRPIKRDGVVTDDLANEVADYVTR